MNTYRALVAELDGDAVTATIREREFHAPPEGEVLVRVDASSLNYKDALALTPGSKVVRSYPIVPGIDLAGTIEQGSSDWSVGTRVIAHGYDLGVSRDGGFSEVVAVPEEWLVALPDSLTPAQAMGIGTAGFTAAMSVRRIIDHGVRPDAGPILVTGASGGVGSMAVDILAGLGYRVHAATGNLEMAGVLRELGAEEVIPRVEVPDRIRPLGSSTWAAAVDSVGGSQLAVILSAIDYGGIVTASGLTGGTDVPTTVLPFILRGVTLAGIDSVQLNIGYRREIWAELGGSLKPRHLDSLVQTVPLDDVPVLAAQLMAAGVGGRVVIRIEG